MRVAHTSYRLYCLSAHCPSVSGICTQCIKYLHKASNICISREKAIFCGHKQAHMAFEWKNSKDIFKGSWIYHLTFAVAGRRPLLWSCAHVALPRILHCWLLSHSYIGGVQRLQHIDENDPRQASWHSPRQGHFTIQLATTELGDFGYRVVGHLKGAGETV